jgi:PAS domain S-box-containing protein
LFPFFPVTIPLISFPLPDEATALNSVSVLSTSSLHLILTLLGTLSIVCGIIIYFSIRLRRVNRELQERNSKILDINEDLQRINIELAEQKESITKEHYESDKFYGMLFKSADDGISFYDRSWNLKYANSAFYSMVGLDAAKYNSIDSTELIHPDDSDYPVRKMQSLTNKGFFESELRLRHSNGYYLNLSTRSVTVRSDTGEILGSLTISRDITRMKQVHNDLVKANSQAEASNRLKTSFLANISHEIRTPLNSVVGFSNLLLSDDLTKEAKEEYIGHINYNSEKLLQIIGDIIDLSRLESSQIEIRYEETSLNSLVNEIVNDTKQIIRRNEKPIILKVTNLFQDQGDLIFTDRMWLKRVLTHLMDNAVKFTLDGSVELIYMLEDNNLAFRVKDTGIGINKENLARIFEEFRQEIDGHHRPFEGLGVGLTLAKEVVERMGGKIFVHSEKGIGSEFGFSLPYRPAGSTRIREMEKTEQVTIHCNWISRKCLLVDDNKDVLIYLKKILTDTGISIITARSGFEAIQSLQNTPDIDLVILDMQMPEMNGIEATREIRKLSKKVSIIAQTAFIFEDDKDIILEAGCDACLIKPIRKDHLLTTMAGFLK